MTAPDFTAAEFAAAFHELLRWRRDVRRFRKDAVPEENIAALLEILPLCPSVGLSQPWRFVRLRSEAARAAMRDNFARCNEQALAGYCGEDAALYAGLKLSGLDDAPVQFAVFCDRETVHGRGLGRRTMPEAADHSVAAAIHTLWLAARIAGIGMGWVSILDPLAVATALDVPVGWKFIALLCLGYPVEEHLDPELQRAGWEARKAECLFER